MRAFFITMAALLGGSPALIAQSSLPAEFNRAREIKSVRPTRNLKSIRVVSWNIDRGSRFGLVSSGLEHAAADLCLLQEVDWNTRRAGKRDVAADLARDLHLNMAYGIEFEELGQESGGPAFIGQATLTRLPIRRSRVLRFERQSGFWKARSWIPSSIPLMQRRVGNRIALVTELELDGRPLVVYNVHLESRSLGKIQNMQLDEIVADLKRYPSDTAAILGGDLNTKYFPAKFLRKLENAGFRSVTGERIERTHVIAMALDWIFVKGPVKIEDGRVRRDIGGSDHYAVYAELGAQ